MGAPFLGRIDIHWCEKCNVPLLSGSCSNCNGKGKKLSVTPPGDTRPAFKYDLELIRKTVDEQFGEGIGEKIFPEGKTILLNKSPSTDRMYEIFMDGKIIGLIRFDSKWVFVPRLEAARRILAISGKKRVEISEDVEPFLLDGKSLLAVGIDSKDESIQSGDYVIVNSPNTISVGISKLPKLVKIKEISKEKGPKTLPNSTWETAVKANSAILENFESKSISFMRQAAKENNLPLTVSFSGGKDSLAVYLLAKEAFEEFTSFFNDTGLEFPETVEYVKSFADILITSANDAFWREFENFGPPARDYRWCCKVCKLGPITQLINEKFPNGCLSFEGMRKYESAQRRDRPKIDPNPWVPNQLSAYPIKGWTSLHVWLYIFSKNVKYNQLYEQGFDRIGCWLCPASSLAEMSRVRETHPGLWKKFEKHLVSWKEKYGYPEEYITEGKWRFRKGKRSTKPTKQIREKITHSFVSGTKPCQKGPGFLVEGKFRGTIDLERTANLLKILGDVRYSELLGTILVIKEKTNMDLFQDGTFTIKTDTKENIEKEAKQFSNIVIRANECAGCGICTGKCPTNSLILQDGKVHVKETCTQCGTCLTVPCPVVKFNKSEGQGSK